jgi:hypothetical protein
MAKRTQKQIKATAIHEAGHAVIARVLTLAAGIRTGHECNYPGMPHSVRFTDPAAFLPFVNCGPWIMGHTVPGRIVIDLDRCTARNNRAFLIDDEGGRHDREYHQRDRILEQSLNVFFFPAGRS